MHVHLVGPYYRYPYSINQALDRAAQLLGWQVTITDHREAIRKKEDWVSELKNSKADFILCAGVEAWFRGIDDPNELPPRILWLREEVRREIILQYAKDVNQFYTHIFYFEPTGQDLLREHGVDTSFLPLSCDPAVFKRYNLQRSLDVVFIGSLSTPEGSFYDGRRRAIEMMSDAGIRIVAKSSWDPEEISKFYSRAKIVWNLGSYWPETGDVEDMRGIGYQNRVFEGMACGALVFNHQVKQGRLFEDGIHLVEYDSDNFIEKLHYYLTHDDERSDIANRGYKKFRQSHTYKQRLEKMAKTLIERGVI